MSENELNPLDLKWEAVSNESGCEVTVIHMPTGTRGKSDWMLSSIRAHEQAARRLRAALVCEALVVQVEPE